ncbi:MAG TPA: DNA-directed RNA polymerase subunit omega [Bdellovibrionota bacterium]|nr:DNA-directed RNA polymerase subunit omega [Bdellovibrionota bacterium]
MARITIEDCLTKVDNRFELVILAAERTKQLLKGSQPLIDDPENKPAVVALREVAEGKVRANAYKKSV